MNLLTILEQANVNATAAVLESRGFDPEKVRNAHRVYRESMGIPENKYKRGPITRGPKLFTDDDAASTALGWIQRCQESEDEALSVMSEIEITAHGDFVKKAMHILSSVGLYTDRNKIVAELVDSLEGTLKACAAHE